jgi:hypothetical protein
MTPVSVGQLSDASEHQSSNYVHCECKKVKALICSAGLGDLPTNVLDNGVHPEVGISTESFCICLHSVSQTSWLKFATTLQLFNYAVDIELSVNCTIPGFKLTKGRVQTDSNVK